MGTSTLRSVRLTALTITTVAVLTLGSRAATAQGLPLLDSGAPTDPSVLTLTAMPPRLGDDGEIKLKPGEKKQVALRVKNSSDQTVQILTAAEDFIIDEDGTTPTPVSETVSNRWSLASWLTLTPASQILKPQETVGLNVLIEVPADALPGGHYAMVTHQPQNTQGLLGSAAQPEGSSGVNQRVGSLLYVVVEGPINEEAFIRDFHFPAFTEKGPVPYHFTIENMSDIHIKPKLGLEIFDALGRRVDSLQPTANNVFPLASRQFSGQWERTWGTGYYTARLTMSFGESGQVVMAKTTFWLLPIKMILAVVAGILALVAVLIGARKRRRTPKSTDRRASEVNNIKNFEQ